MDCWLKQKDFKFIYFLDEIPLKMQLLLSEVLNVGMSSESVEPSTAHTSGQITNALVWEVCVFVCALVCVCLCVMAEWQQKQLNS